MKRLTWIIATVVVAAVINAQQRGPQRPGTPPAGPQSTVSGTVVQFTAGAGIGMPTLVIRTNGTDVSLILGPYRILLDAGFSASPGDLVEATVINCSECAHGLAVIAVKNITNGTSAILRDSDGTPRWNGGPRGGGRGQHGPAFGSRNQNCIPPDMTRIETFPGTVVSFAGGPGVGRPTLVLATAGGERSVLVSPYHAIIEAGFEFVAGATLTVTAVPDSQGQWVVIELKDTATGTTLQLRDSATGLPIGGRTCGGAGHGPRP
jgi:hypothetical protein